MADNEHTRRARELLARSNELLRPRFDVEEWSARRPDPENRHAWKAWLAELPDEAPVETQFEKWQRECKAEAERKAKARETKREERATREREALAAKPRNPVTARIGPRSSTVPAWLQPGSAKFVVK